MSKPLKESNRWNLWLVVAINTVFIYTVLQTHSIAVSGLSSALTDVDKLVPVGVSVLITTVLNGLLSANTKARLVFLRWHNALPGHRAFTKYGKSDPRVDLVDVEKLLGAALPAEPRDQNKAWFRMYKAVENAPAVVQVHKDFLLLRDYTGLSLLFLLVYGGAGLYMISEKITAFMYVGILVAQFAVVRVAAANYGIRMVTTVLSESSRA